MKTSKCIYEMVDNAMCTNCSYPYVNGFTGGKDADNLDLCRTWDELHFAHGCIRGEIGASRNGGCPGPCTDPKFTSKVISNFGMDCETVQTVPMLLLTLGTEYNKKKGTILQNRLLKADRSHFPSSDL